MKKIFFLLITIFLSTSFTQETGRFITVNGNSEITLPADCIDFVIQIKNVSESLEKSREVNVNAANRLAGIFNDFKISKDDWEISPIQFGKEYNYTRDERKFVGYYSIVNVTVKLKNLDTYYEFIQKLSQNTLYEITRSNYGLSDYKKYHKEAIIKAVKAAREKAEYIAQSLQVKTGKILQVTEQDHFQPVARGMLNTMENGIGGGKAEVSGDIKIIRSVNMKVEITD